MKFRKVVSVALIAAFLQLSVSCVSTRQRSPNELKGPKTYKVVRVLKKSGETIEFGKDRPAYLRGDEIRTSGEIRLAAEQVRQEKQGDTYILTTKSGHTYRSPWVQRSGMYLIIQAPPTEPIPLSDVSMVWTRQGNGVGTALVVLGGIVAATGIAALIVMLTKESCPFLYADDGTEFRLEGELYSGAVFKGLERRDFLKLHSLAATPEGYRLKIANEADETQYTDELTLIAVDHPKDIDVYAGSDGVIHTVRSPEAPLAAEDFEGKDFTASVSAADGRMWSSNPVGKDPEDPANWKSGLVLRFPKPPSAGQAKLVVRIGNTYWADFAFGKFFGLKVPAMQPWYQKVGADAGVRAKGERLMTEQGLGLKVQVQGRNGWRDAGFFYPTGPFGIQDDVLTVPLESTPDDVLTVRLQGGTFFWMIDYAAVDYSPDLPVDAQALSPAKALDDSGKDIRASLLRTDADYFVMPEPGNHAFVTFPAPPARPGMERSLLLRTSGYYTMHPRDQDAFDLEKLLAIRQNPDLFLKFSLQEMQRQILAATAPAGAPVKSAARRDRP